MKRRLIICLLFIILFALLPISLFSSLNLPVVRGVAACTIYTGFPQNELWWVQIPVKAGDTIRVVVQASGLTISLPDGSLSFANPTTVTTSGTAQVVIAFGGFYTIYVCSPDETPMFADGRCNLEADQSVAVYPDGKGGYYFYAIYESKGYFALHLTKDDLEASPDTGENYLIAEAGGVQVYRLKGGKLQVKRLLPDGKSYDFIWPPCH